MIDHMTLTVRDLAQSRAFYERALAPLGYRVVMEFGEMFAFGDEKPFFWMKQGDPPTTPQHISFTARRRADVDAFHAAALAAGGRDNGPPGLRADYHPSYYGAFVFDPDGHNIEAVNHREGAPARRAAKARTASRGASKKKRGAGTKAKRRGAKAKRR